MDEKEELTESGMTGKRNLVVGLIVAVIFVVFVSVVATFSNAGLNDAFFVSDESKYVLNMETNAEDLEKYDNAPLKTHIVYYYEGDKITGMEAYYEFADAAAAKALFPEYEENFGDTELYAGVRQENKYIVVAAPESAYEGISASKVAEQIEKYNNGESEDATSENTGDAADKSDATETTNTANNK